MHGIGWRLRMPKQTKQQKIDELEDAFKHERELRQGDNQYLHNENAKLKKSIEAKIEEARKEMERNITRSLVGKIEDASRDESIYDHSTNTEKVTRIASDEVKLFAKDLIITILRDCSKIDQGNARGFF